MIQVNFADVQGQVLYDGSVQALPLAELLELFYDMLNGYGAFDVDVQGLAFALSERNELPACFQGTWAFPIGA